MFDDIHSFENAKIQYYIGMINGYGPYRFLNTLSFQYLITDDQGREFADIYWRRTTKKILEKRRMQPATSVWGVAVLERAAIRKDGGGPKNCHFHFLVKDHPAFSRDDSEAAAQLREAGWKASRNFRTTDGHTLVSQDGKGIDVRLVYSSDVVGYLCKDAGQFGWRSIDRLFHLDRNGLISADATPLHRMF